MSVLKYSVIFEASDGVTVFDENVMREALMTAMGTDTLTIFREALETVVMPEDRDMTNVVDLPRR